MSATSIGEPIRVGPIEIRFRLEAAQTAGSLSMFEFLVPRGARVPAPHSHEAFEETVYGLEGVNRWTVDGWMAKRASFNCSRVSTKPVAPFGSRAKVSAKYFNSVVLPQPGSPSTTNLV